MAPQHPDPFLSSPHFVYRGVLDDTVAKPLTPASLQASRLCKSSQGYVFSSGSSVFHVKCIPTRKRSHPDEEAGDKKVEVEADDFLIPSHRFSTLDVTRDLAHSTHACEVQSVACTTTGGGRLASVDGSGRCVVTHMTSTGNNDTCNKAYNLNPVSRYDGTSAWAGISLPKNGGKDSEQMVIGRELYRDVTVFDVDMPVHTYHTLGDVHALTHISSSAIGNTTITVAEGGDLVLYDTRHQSAVMRKQVSTHANSPLLCVDGSPDGNTLITAGAERIVHVLDVRAGLTPRERWQGCLKNACAGVALSRKKGLAYVCSTDNEVACGAIDVGMAREIGKAGADDADSGKMMSGANARSKKRAFGFRADVRVIGMCTSYENAAEDVAVVTEAKSFYVLRSSMT